MWCQLIYIIATPRSLCEYMTMRLFLLIPMTLCLVSICFITKCVVKSIFTHVKHAYVITSLGIHLEVETFESQTGNI